MSATATTYPDVPDAAGVPPLLREPGAFATEDANGGSDDTMMTSDGSNVSQNDTGPVWGLYDQNGNPVLIADSVLGVDHSQEYRVSDYPVEDGGFASFNKVRRPADSKISFTIGGSISERADFLSAVEAVTASLDLYTVVTPEISYPTVTAVHHDLRRTAQEGATLLVVDVWVREIRVTATTAYTKTKMPSGADPVQGGTVQPRTASDNEQALLQSRLS